VSGIEDAKPGGDDIEVTASIGVAVSTQEGLGDPAALIEAADGAMYKSKRTGRRHGTGPAPTLNFCPAAR